MEESNNCARTFSLSLSLSLFGLTHTRTPVGNNKVINKLNLSNQIYIPICLHTNLYMSILSSRRLSTARCFLYPAMPFSRAWWGGVPTCARRTAQPAWPTSTQPSVGWESCLGQTRRRISGKRGGIEVLILVRI